MSRIRVIDFETTGWEPPAQVCETGYCDVAQSADGWRVDQWKSALCGVDSMPPEVRAVHHISLPECAGLDPFAPEIMWTDAKNNGVVLIAAHNADFEAKFWGDPQLPVLCTYKAVLRVWPDAPSHSNGALRYWLEDQGLIAPDHEATMPPHRAGPDAYVTAHILTALMRHATTREMVAWTKEPRLLPRCTLGKFKGAPWPEVEAGFLGWMLRQETMEEDLKWNARREIARRENEK
jgi:exodeoxyribonuclease X